MVERVRLRAGSSPLARGTPYLGAHVLQARGLIPARAGNTPAPRYAARPIWAHPRSRGEHVVFMVSHSPAAGSSPLARGTRSVPGVGGEVVGLIPARAGNTYPGGATGRTRRAHPRSRGEHAFQPALTACAMGSSPLARGTLHRQKIPRPMDGLIPRSRGEHTPASLAHSRGSGSSPLARGTLGFVLDEVAVLGLIPARAGNT